MRLQDLLEEFFEIIYADELFIFVSRQQIKCSFLRVLRLQLFPHFVELKLGYFLWVCASRKKTGTKVIRQSENFHHKTFANLNLSLVLVAKYRIN